MSERIEWPQLYLAFFCAEARAVNGVWTFVGVGDTFVKPLEGSASPKLLIGGFLGPGEGEAIAGAQGFDPDGKLICAQEWAKPRSPHPNATLWGGVVEIDRPAAGTFWFQIWIDGKFMTKIPLRMIAELPSS